jgi:hypothetical protein
MTSIRPAAIVWVALMTSALLNAWLGDGHGPAKVAAVAVIVIAFVKVRLVGHYFMEVRGAPLPLRVVFDTYIGVVSCGLIGIYLIGT